MHISPTAATDYVSIVQGQSFIKIQMIDVYLHLFSYGTGNKIFISSLIDVVVRIVILYK